MGLISAISDYFWPRPQRRRHTLTTKTWPEPNPNSGPNYLADGGPTNPRLRASVTETSITIYGYPKRLIIGGSHLLNLTTRTPAKVAWILGEDWRSRCVATTSNNRGLKEWSYIVAPDDEEDEAKHCLQMRRCGAYLTQPGLYRSPNTEDYNEKISRYIMGWPSNGGVLVFHLPSNNPADKTLEEQFASLARYDAGIEEEPCIKFGRLRDELAKQNKMDGFCEVLNRWGSERYEDISNCPEVQDLRLLNSEESNKFLYTIPL
ncbi:hypothetical protein B0J14DRAFT_595412, partial [Halenospora varia]